MAVYSKDFQENGTQFYPVTHIDAVIDGNGNTLASLLDEKEDSITPISTSEIDALFV